MKTRLAFLALSILVLGIDLPQPFSGRLSARDVPEVFDPFFTDLPEPNTPIDRNGFTFLANPLDVPNSTLGVASGGRLIFIDVRNGRIVSDFTPFSGFRDPISFAMTSTTGGATPDVLIAGPLRSSMQPIGFFRLSTPPTLIDSFPDPWSEAGGFRATIADVDAGPTQEFIFSSGPGGPGSVSILVPERNQQFGFGAFGAEFRGGISVAAGDLNGDGKAEILTGQENGGELRVFDVVGDRVRMRGMGRAFGHGYSGGIRVAAGDLNGDGRADIITAPIQGEPRVRVFNINGPSVSVLADFFAFERPFQGGVFIAPGVCEGVPFIAASAGDQFTMFQPTRTGEMRGIRTVDDFIQSMLSGQVMVNVGSATAGPHRP